MSRWLEWLLGMPAFQEHIRPVQERASDQDLYEAAEQAWGLRKTIHGGLEPLDSETGLIVAANHPRGLIELFVAGGWLQEQTGRPVRFVVNRLIGETFSALNDHIIGVDNMSQHGPERSAFNRAALSKAEDFLRAGGVLYVCPAGQVASWRLRSPEGWFRQTDHPWHPTFVALARQAGTPIQPLHLSGCNRLRYRVARLFGLVFGRMMNFREFISSVDFHTHMQWGNRIEVEVIRAQSDQAVSRLCRDRVFSCAERTGSL